jgi:hypothetical protein
MPIKRIIAFGCSWTYGDELIDPKFRHLDHLVVEEFKDHYDENTPWRLSHCYAGLVAEHFGLEFENCAFPGASLESMRWTCNYIMQNYTNLDETLWLVGLTDATRISWFNPQHEVSMKDPAWNRHVHSTWLAALNPDIDESWFELQKLWIAMSYDRQWADYNHNLTVSLFDYVKHRTGASVIQFNCLPNNYSTNAPSLLYNNLSWFEILQQKRKELSINPFASGNHPNEEGHEIISKHLIEHIKYAKLLR